MRRFVLAAILTLLSVSVHAAAVTFGGAGDVTIVTAVRDAFRTQIGGGTTAGADGSFGGVRREINWDGVPDVFAAPNAFPANFFNVNSPRGVVFSTPGTGFQVSANAASGTPVEFGNLNPSYPTTFEVFSPERLFTPILSNVTDVMFFVPGTSQPATVNAFGAVFTSVNAPGTSIQYFDPEGASLGTFIVPTSGPAGLSFFGVAFNAGERVARVRIVTGTAATPANDAPPASDIAVMDDFIYSEPLVLTVSIDDVVVSEGGSAVFTVSLSHSIATPLVVTYGTSDGSAQVADADYTAVPAGTTVTIPAGSTSETITIATTADATVESDETFFVNLTDAGIATIADAQGQGTIVNDDVAVPTLSINDVAASEGNAGTTNFVFTVTLSAATLSSVTATWTTADGTATAPADYAAGSGLVSFAPGETSKTVTIAVAGDTLVEPNETFFVNLSLPSGATLGDAQGQGTIVNDDIVLPTLSIGDLSQAEGNAGTTNFVFTVTLSAAAASPVSVNWATADGTATTPADYAAASGVVTFAPGETSKTITVNVVGDLASEANETFMVTLSSPTGATIVDGEAVGTIANDDAAIVAAIPTMSEWMLLLLALGLVAFGALRLR